MMMRERVNMHAVNIKYLSIASDINKLLPINGGSKGWREGCAPPLVGSKFFQFHAVFGEIWQNRMLAAPPGGLAPPSRGNPGSATASDLNKCSVKGYNLFNLFNIQLVKLEKR